MRSRGSFLLLAATTMVGTIGLAAIPPQPRFAVIYKALSSTCTIPEVESKEFWNDSIAIRIGVE